MNKNIKSFLILSFLFLIPRPSLAQNLLQTHKEYIVVKVDQNSTTADIIKFNKPAGELGAPKGQFLLRSEECEKIIFANGKELFLKKKITRST